LNQVVAVEKDTGLKPGATRAMIKSRTAAWKSRFLTTVPAKDAGPGSE
jgi:hypothetical protein